MSTVFVLGRFVCSCSRHRAAYLVPPSRSGGTTLALLANGAKKTMTERSKGAEHPIYDGSPGVVRRRRKTSATRLLLHAVREACCYFLTQLPLFGRMSKARG